MNTDNLISILTRRSGNHMVDNCDDRPTLSSLEENHSVCDAKINLIMDAIAYNESFLSEIRTSDKQRKTIEAYLTVLSDLLLDYETEKDVITADIFQGNYRKGY